ncbi:retrovirus polyprotein [Purpureocillium lavendulum]|uniref:Retrovirus polyprotein n=1 Tax=Purpureocillium lavendulum TaxID=1247861 RepID=A0AB34FEH6_9HYPO|nr:retrovirus polyprotein [Purpureocillium lavendulum]
MGLLKLREEIATWGSSATIVFPRTQRYFLAFIDEVLPRWPILSVQQVYRAYELYYGCCKPGMNDITPEYRIFSYVLAIGSLVCHLKDPDQHNIEEAHCGQWPTIGVYAAASLGPMVQIQLLALDFLHCRYLGLNSQPQFLGMAAKMQLGHDADWFHMVVIWTCVNLVWEHPRTAPLVLDPRKLPWPQETQFKAVYGENAWNDFLARSINSQAYYKIRCDIVPIHEATFYGHAGEDDGWIMHMAGPLIELQSLSGGLRFCVGQCALNAITKKNRYPLPLIEESLRSVSKAKWPTEPDVIAAFHNVRVAEERMEDGFPHAIRALRMAGDAVRTDGRARHLPALHTVREEFLDEFRSAYIDEFLIYSSGFEATSVKYLSFIAEAGKGIRVDPDKRNNRREDLSGILHGLADHLYLRYFTKKQPLSERQAQWAETLLRYNLTIVHRPGRDAAVPDTLSRREQEMPHSAEDERLPGRLLEPAKGGA